MKPPMRALITDPQERLRTTPPPPDMARFRAEVIREMTTPTKTLSADRPLTPMQERIKDAVLMQMWKESERVEEQRRERQAKRDRAGSWVWTLFFVARLLAMLLGGR